MEIYIESPIKPFTTSLCWKKYFFMELVVLYIIFIFLPEKEKNKNKNNQTKYGVLYTTFRVRSRRH